MCSETTTAIFKDHRKGQLVKKLPLICLVTSLLLSTACLAGSPVWKISKDKESLFIGGTFHLLTQSDYPLPLAFDTAYQNSTSIFLETDIKALQSPEYAGLMMQTLMQPAGKTLENTLSPSTYQSLKKFLSAREIPVENFSPYTPTGVALTISLLALQKLGFRPDLGVDQHFSNKASKDGKRIEGLETPSEHIAFLSDLGKGQEDEFILKTIKDIEQMSDIMNTLKEAWRSGDNKKLSSMAIKDIQKEFPEVYASLLTNRNEAWMIKIEKMLKTQSVEFVLVGAMHLAGEDGLITQLKNRGYTIENL